MPSPCKTILRKETTRLSRDSSADGFSSGKVESFMVAPRPCVQPAFWQGWVVALQQGKSRSLAHLREKVVLCCTFSALFFLFIVFSFPFCFLFRLY